MEKGKFNGPVTHKGFIETVVANFDVDEDIKEAFAAVDRAQFVQPSMREHPHTYGLVYADIALPLKEGATTSQPSMIARMIDCAELVQGQTVLEVGTATGYEASLLSKLAREVHTIELDRGLCEAAKANFKKLGITNVHVHHGDGAKGIPGMQFDRIIIAAGVKSVPEPLKTQVKDGGIIVAPVGPHPENCRLHIMQKLGDEFVTIERQYCNFVPLYSHEAGGWQSDELEP